MELLERENPISYLERERIESVHKKVSEEYPASDTKITVSVTNRGRSTPALAKEEDDFSDLSGELRELSEELHKYTDTAEFEADEAIDVQANLPQDFVYAHELGHKYFKEFGRPELGSSPLLVRSALSEMFAEATAYHFTEHEPEDEVLERDPFEEFSSAESEELSKMEDPYEEVKDNQYDGPIDIPHKVGCRLGSQLIENGGKPMDIINNISEYGEAVKEVAKETLEYAQNAENPDIEELDPAYEEILEGM
jgi:hypothetical protein